MPLEQRVRGGLPVILAAAVICGSPVSDAKAASLMYGTDQALQSHSAAKDRTIITSLFEEKWDSRTSVGADRQAGRNLGALERNGYVAVETGRASEQLMWSALLIALASVGLFGYASRRKRLSGPPPELGRRRFQGRLQTAFSWRETDHPPLAKAD